MRVSWLSFVFALCIGLEAAAQTSARVLNVPPINIGSAHGDIVCGNPQYETNSQACLEYFDFPTADLKAAGTEKLGLGVLYSIHLVSVSLTNVSTVPQTVDVVLQSGSGMSMEKQTFTTMGTATHTVGSDMVTPAIALPASTSTQIVYRYICYVTSPTCCVYATSSAGDVGSCVTTINPTTHGSNGVMAASFWKLQVRVREARGAVTGSLSTRAHRAMGAKDKTNGEGTITLNGGRAF